MEKAEGSPERLAGLQKNVESIQLRLDSLWSLVNKCHFLGLNSLKLLHKFTAAATALRQLGQAQ